MLPRHAQVGAFAAFALIIRENKNKPCCANFSCDSNSSFDSIASSAINGDLPLRTFEPDGVCAATFDGLRSRWRDWRA